MRKLNFIESCMTQHLILFYQALMTILEPWTFLTDLAIALISFYFSFKIKRDPQSLYSKSYRLWWGTFLCIGLSALQGALFHGFAHVLPTLIYKSLRLGTLWSLIATSIFISLSLLNFCCNQKSKYFQIFQFLIYAKAFLFFSISLYHSKFIVAISDYGTTFVIALIIFSFNFKKSGSSGMILGIIVSIIAALIQVFKIAPSSSFNHNDLYHVVQLFGLYLFYINAPKLRDKIIA